MNHKILFICLFAVLIFNSVLAVPTYTSVSVSPNSVKLGQNVSVSSVASYGFSVNDYNWWASNYYSGVTVTTRWSCSPVRLNKSGYLNTVKTTVYVNTTGSNELKIYSYAGLGLGGTNLATKTLVFGGATGASCKGATATFSNSELYLYKDTNYYFCYKSGSTPEGFCGACGVANDMNKGCIGVNVHDLPTVQMNCTNGFASSCGGTGVNRLAFDVSLFDNKPIRIKGISAGGNYDTNTIFTGAYYNSSPLASFINPFSTDFILQTKIEGSDGIYSVDKNVLISVLKPETSYLTITNISNLKKYEYGSILLYPQNENEDIIIKVDSNSASPETPEFKILNSLRNGKQYFIYTANETNYNLGVWVFDDSLTFSDPVFSEPIQKLWNSQTNEYEYSFYDSLSENESKYYKLVYSSPAMYWSTQNADWFKQLAPTNNDLNGFVYDQFTVSTYANLANYPIKPLSQLIGNQNINYEFQFTGYASDLNANVLVYLKDINGKEYLVETVNVDTNKKRFSVSLNPNSYNQYIELKTTNIYPVTINLVDYAIIPRGYFVAPLNIYSPDGSGLPLIVQNENYFQYIKENGGFLAQTSINDRAGDLNMLVVTAHFDVNSDSNGAKKYYIPLSGSGNQVLTQSLDGLVDLTDTATNVIVKFTLYDQNGLIVSEQTKTVKFLQFPYFPSDLVLAINDSAQLIGESPKGRITLISPNPENILGLEFYIYNDTNTPATPNYYTVLYKDIDFSCLANDCSFNYELNDFAFSKESYKWFITAQVLLNTRNKTTPTKNQANVFYVTSITKIINFLALKTARVVQTFERTDNDYKNTEQIGLTVEIVNALHDDIRGKAGVNIELVGCGGAGYSDPTNCLFTDLTYKVAPISTAYDPATGTNYFIFRNVYLSRMVADSLLQDGNYYEVKATIYDRSGQYSDDNKLIYMSKKATTGVIDTTTGEILLKIDNAKTLTAPTFSMLGCSKLDQTDYFKISNLEFDCFVYYTIKDQSPDKFTFRLSNENSDFTEQTPSLRQYFEVEIPYNLIAINDGSIMDEGFYNQDITCNPLDVLCRVAGFWDTSTNPVCYENRLNAIQCKALLYRDFNIFFATNIGADYNFSHYGDPSYTNGLFKVKISNPNIINMVDYYGVNSEIENINPKYFIRYANTENISLPNGTTTISVFGSLINPFLTYKSNNYLVINETPKESYTDSNGVTRTAPTILNFDLSSNLIYNSGLDSTYKYVQLSYSTAIVYSGQLLDDVITGVGEFVANPVDFTFKHIWIISISLMLIFIVGFIVRTWSGG